MDVITIHQEVANKTYEEVSDNPISVLADFQLALIGGGVGEVIVG